MSNNFINKGDMMKILLFAMVIFGFNGCSYIKTKICDNDNAINEKPQLVLNELTPLELKPVSFVVLTENNVDTKFENLKEQDQDLVFVGLTDNNYENLSLNMKMILNYIKLQSDKINAYKEYYKVDE